MADNLKTNPMNDEDLKAHKDSRAFQIDKK